MSIPTTSLGLLLSSDAAAITPQLKSSTESCHIKQGIGSAQLTFGSAIPKWAYIHVFVQSRNYLDGCFALSSLKVSCTKLGPSKTKSIRTTKRKFCKMNFRVWLYYEMLGCCYLTYYCRFIEPTTVSLRRQADFCEMATLHCLCSYRDFTASNAANWLDAENDTKLKP